MRHSTANGTDPDLVLKALGEQSLPGCFDSQPKIQIQTYEFKDVFDPAAKRTYHLRAYVFRPNHIQRKRPAVLSFFGGGWRRGNPMAWFPQDLYFASRGAVAIAFQYRVEKIHGASAEPNPNIAARAVSDARSALYWVRDNAANLDIDLSRVALAGDSAGGHLALETVLVDRIQGEPEAKDGFPLRPRAILALYPVTDTEGLVDGPGKPDLNFADVSPIQQLVSGNPLPATQIIQGRADGLQWTLPEKTMAFCRRANELANSTNPCQLELLEEPVDHQGKALFQHGFMTTPEAYRRMMITADSFLTAQGILESDPRTAAERVATMRPECVSDSNKIDLWSRQFGFGAEAEGGAW